MKKFVAVLIAALMLLMTCAFAEGDFNVVDPAIEGTLSFYVYYADSNVEIYDAAKAMMAEKYPNLTIEFIHRADSDGSALRTWAAVGELPDFFEVTNADTYDILLKNGDLYAVDTAMETTSFYDKFNGGELYQQAHTEADGHQYGFGAAAGNVFTVFYNIPLFEELGLTEPTNFEEFKHCITVLKEAGKIPVALFAAEQWPGMAFYELACVAEGAYEANDAINDGKATYEGDEAYRRAAEKFEEVASLGAFGTGALSTNASQAIELNATGEAGFLGLGSWQWTTAEAEGYGDKLGWCHYNVFADADKAEEVKNHCVGGKISKCAFSVNTNPPSGMDPETVAMLAAEFLYDSELYGAQQGRMTIVKGDFDFVGHEGYADFNQCFGDFVSFTTFPWAFSNGQLVSSLGNAVEMMVSGNFTADDFIEEMIACGF